MKKILNLLGTITLIGTSTTSLVAFNTSQEKIHKPEELTKLKEKNKIDTNDENIKKNLEWMAPQEKPFSKIDNKWYFVIWKKRGSFDWKITKFNNNKGVIEIENHLMKTFQDLNYWETVDQFAKTLYPWKTDPQFFKSVYRWNLTAQEPNLIIDNNGNVKVNE